MSTPTSKSQDPAGTHPDDLRAAQAKATRDTLYVVESDQETTRLLGEICLQSGAYLYLSQGTWNDEVAHEVTSHIYNAFRDLIARNPRDLTRDVLLNLAGHDADQFPSAPHPSGVTAARPATGE